MDTLGFTGARLRTYNRIHPNALPTTREHIVNQLIQRQGQINRNAQRKAQQKAFEAEQARLFEAEMERERKKQEKQAEKIRLAQVLAQAQQEWMNKQAIKKANYKRGAQKRAENRNVRTESLAPIQQEIWALPLNQLPPFELPSLMLSQMKLKPHQTVALQFVDGNTIVDEFDAVTDKDGNVDTWFHYNGSEGMTSTTRRLVLRSTDFRITLYKPIKAVKKPQSFRDSVQHCVLAPIKDFLVAKAHEEKTNKYRNNRMTLANRCDEFMVQYDAGIPEDELETVAKGLGCGIVIHNLSGHELTRYNRGHCSKNFHFINSRMNHVEMIDLNRVAESIEKEDAIRLIETLIANRMYNYYTGSTTNPKSIITATNHYIVGDANTKTLFDFTGSFDNGMFLNYCTDSDLCNFIMKGAHLTINWKNPKAKSKIHSEIDMKQAYTQFKSCSMYQGFPAIINNWRQTESNHDVLIYPGIYTVQIRHLVDIPLLRAYGFSCGTFILTSPWIAKLLELGVSLDVLNGAWGTRMDFEFSDAMKDEKLYAIWTGMQLHRDTDCHYKMACGSEFAEIVMGQHTEDNVRYNAVSQTLMINKKKDAHRIMPHVSAFIISYTQLTVFEEALKYDVRDIIAHKLDSIVLACPVKSHSSIWQACEGTIKMNQFTSSIIFNKDKCDVSFSSTYLGNCFLSGQGGSGKTHTILSDKGFKNVTYVSTSWALISDKMTEYKVHGASINQLLGFDIYGKKIESIKDKFGQPGVIAVDEPSMIHRDNIHKIQTMYPLSQIIILGDYANGMYFQSSICSELYHPLAYHIIDADYRSIDEETRMFKQHVRKLMMEGKPVLEYVMSLPSVTLDELKEMYDMDYVLTGTHKRIEMFNSLLTSEKNHHQVMKHNFSDITTKCAGGEAYLHGEILDFPIEGRTQIAHGFTVHAFQGKTIDSAKCFVDITSLTSNQDIYTAISRVRSIRQLYLISREIKSVVFNKTYFYTY